MEGFVFPLRNVQVVADARGESPAAATREDHHLVVAHVVVSFVKSIDEYLPRSGRQGVWRGIFLPLLALLVYHFFAQQGS
jgi:hypothetical protein